MAILQLRYECLAIPAIFLQSDGKRMVDDRSTKHYTENRYRADNRVSYLARIAVSTLSQAIIITRYSPCVYRESRREKAVTKKGTAKIRKETEEAINGGSRSGVFGV